MLIKNTYFSELQPEFRAKEKKSLNTVRAAPLKRFVANHKR